MSDAILTIYNKEGIRNGFFKGGLVSSMQNGPFAGLYFLFFVRLKPICNDNSFLSGIFAGILATIITNPLDLIRARLQYQNVNLTNDFYY